MKPKHLIPILFSTLITIIIACNNTSPEVKSIPISDKEGVIPKIEILAENKVAVEMKVEGMVCAMGCAKFIEEKVAEVDGVASSKVDFEEGVAYFEFDKTVLKEDEIVSFINDIHDGQYKAKIIEEKEVTEEEEVSTEDEESITSVVEQFNFSFPELLTYFMKRL